MENQVVNLLEPVGLIHRHLTVGLCRRVHRQTRKKERQRKWTLYYLARFWIAVILRAPASLTQALEDSPLGKDGLFPRVRATSEAFFQKCRDLSWEFFLALYQGFTESIWGEAPRVYAQSLGKVWERFPAIVAVDGSKCDAIRKRLKLLWNEKGVVLPGCITAFYDLARGITRTVLFSPDAAQHELPRAIAMLKLLPERSLVIGDRLYALMEFFRALTGAKLFGLFRRNKLIKLRVVEVLSRKQGSRAFLEDALVEAGSGQTGAKVILRRIRYRCNGFRRDLITNVLDPKKLSAEEALQIYPMRWGIERLFFDLKEILNLHSFYAANPNAVAMQVYAAAIVHTAFRVAQARIAENHGITPERISPAKLYPRLAAASCAVVEVEVYHQELDRLNPGKRRLIQTLVRPDLNTFAFARTTLKAIMVEHRKGGRRKKRFHPARRRWKSLSHVKGFENIRKLS